MGPKWDQEFQSGNKRITKWGQSGAKNPKVGTREELSEGEQRGPRIPKVGTREEQSGNKAAPRFPKWEQERNYVGTKRSQ